MKSNNPLQDIIKSLPKAAHQFKQEADKIGKSVLNAQLKKADIVTREEFEEQKAILTAALAKLQSIEEKIDTLLTERS